MNQPLAGMAHPRRTVFAASSLLMAAATAALGVWLGQHVSLSLAYVVPIGLMAWGVGFPAALLLALACAADWLLVGAGQGHPDPNPELPVWTTLVEFGFFSVIAWTLAALRASLDRQRALATTDDVTGAPNRRAFYDRALLEMDRIRRSGSPLTLVFLDLDSFKAVNDRFGHRAGDELLRSVARTLAVSLRAVDFVARLGGDEFGILLPETDEADARTVLEKLRAELRGVFVSGGWPVTSSAGAVTFSACPPSVDSALSEADALLYAVKAAGKDAVAHRTLGTARASSGSVAALAGRGHTRVRT